MRVDHSNLDASDIIDPAGYGVRGYPHAEWARLRREAPVCWIEQAGFDAFWAITKHADVRYVGNRPDLFLNAPRMAIGFGDSASENTNLGEAGVFRSLLNMDPPEHRVFRALASRWFSSASIQRLEPRVNEIIEHLLIDLSDSDGAGECDFVSAVASRLPLKVICHLIGLPEEDEELIQDLSTLATGADDPEFKHLDEASDQRLETRTALFTYFRDLAQDRRRNPRDDLATALANADLGDGQLSDLDLLSYLTLIVVAGHETTRNALSGGLLALINQPDEFERLRRDASLFVSATEEILRWTSPIVHFARTAAEDVELRGQHIHRGDTLALFYPSANRDEEVFDAPFEFRVDRDPNPHVAFGWGEHYCLGIHLARLEVRAFLRALVIHDVEIELAGAVELLAGNLVSGVKHLPCRYQRRRHLAPARNAGASSANRSLGRKKQ